MLPDRASIGVEFAIVALGAGPSCVHVGIIVTGPRILLSPKRVFTINFIAWNGQTA